MSDIVFILGAGASKLAGAPLMNDFLDVAQDLLWSGKVEDKKADFIRVFDTIGRLQSVHSKAQLDLTNVESVFTALELGKVIRRVPGLEAAQIPEIIAALKQLIVKTLEVAIEFPIQDKLLVAPAPYPAFANLLRDLREKASPAKSSSVITFNYDVSLDMALHRAGLGPDYVIGPDRDVNAAIQLMKLHGSLNWFADSTEQIRIFGLRELDHELMTHYWQKFAFPDRKTFTIPFGSIFEHYYERTANVKIEPTPVIVPPSWNKTDYHSVLSDVWAKAAEHLSAARYVFVIGYSLPMTDFFFRHLYALGSVGVAPLNKIAVFNPEPERGEVDVRFRELLGPGAVSRYEYCPIKFESAINHIRHLFRAD